MQQMHQMVCAFRRCLNDRMIELLIAFVLCVIGLVGLFSVSITSQSSTPCLWHREDLLEEEWTWKSALDVPSSWKEKRSCALYHIALWVGVSVALGCVNKTVINNLIKWRNDCLPVGTSHSKYLHKWQNGYWGFSFKMEKSTFTLIEICA